MDVISKTTHGYSYYCPACKSMHHLDARWKFNGNMESPSFDGSVLVTCDRPSEEQVRESLKHKSQEFIDELIESMLPLKCHSHIINGEIVYCKDSTHELAGQTVQMSLVG